MMNRTLPVLFSPQGTIIHPTETKIQKFKELQEGWHYGEGAPFENTILDSAVSLNQEAIGLAFFDTDAFPGLNGEIMFSIYWNEHYLEFTLEQNESVTFYHEREGEEICYLEALSFQDAKARIREFRKEIWKWSESLAESTMTADCTDSQASHLRIQMYYRWATV